MLDKCNRLAGRHDLHLILGALMEQINEGDPSLLYDGACGGHHKLPIFFREDRSFASKCAEVDAAQTVGINGQRCAIGVLEIEEKASSGGGFRPERLFGKFMGASAGLWLGGPDGERIGLLPGFFLQILNTAQLPAGSSKPRQYDQISADIDERFLPMQWIREYWHMTGTPDEFVTEPYVQSIRQFLRSMKKKYGR